MAYGFPVPVSNDKIPRGWFAALVRFMNSLLLRGDGRYFAVTHTTEGTTIKPTPALIQALKRAGGAAPAAGGGGATYGIEATIDGSTASIALVEGGTASSISLIPTAPVTLTAGANGELIIGSTASGSGMVWPYYSDFTNRVQVSGGTTYSTSSGGWIAGTVSAVISGATLGQDSDYNVHVDLYDLQHSTNSLRLIVSQCYSAIKAVSGSTYYRTFPVIDSPVLIAVPPGYAFQFGSGYSIESGTFSIDYSSLYFYENN